MRIFISKRKGYMDIFEEKRQLIEKIACQKEDTLESKLELKQLLLKTLMEGNYINTGLLIKMDILLKILKKELCIVLWWKLLMIRLIVNLGIHLKLCTKHRVSDYEKEINKKIYIFTECVNVLRGDSEINNYTNEQKENIKKLLKNKELQDFWLKFKKEKIDKSKLNLEDNKKYIIQIIKIVLLDEIKSKYGVTEDVFKFGMDNMSEESMYVLSNEDFNINEFAIAKELPQDMDEISIFTEVLKKLYPTYK